MSRKTFVAVIILMSVSLTGIVAVQALWIKNALEVKAEQFDRSVSDAMSDVVQRLERTENMVVLSQINQSGYFYNYSFPELDSLQAIQNRLADTFQQRLREQAPANSDLQWLQEDYQSSMRIYSWADSLRTEFNVTVNAPGITYIKENNGSDKYRQDTSPGRVYVMNDTGNVVIRSSKRTERKSEELMEMLDRVVIEVESFDMPLSKRLDKDYLQGQIRKSLNDNGIMIPFEYAIVSGMDENLVPVKSENFHKESLNTPYRTSLFPNDLLHRPDFLLLTFPEISTHLWRSIFLLLLGSVLFTLIIVVTFFVTIRVILTQKKVSEIKSDFINNMTHEFKTPIATISLAVDSIESPKVLDFPDKIKYFTGIIRDENRRMNKQVETVLQMAMIDKKDFRLHIREIDAHDIIRRAANHLGLQLEKKNGKIDLSLNAENPLIENDEMHFYNIINNLLDNAIKYSDEPPEIRVITENTREGIAITVADKGVGISKEAQEKIFDRFYRVSSGDVHNVKGFGLGLSYVKALVHTFGGSIGVESDPGKGSCFRIVLPARQKDELQTNGN